MRAEYKLGKKKHCTGIVSISQLEGAGGTRDRQLLLEWLASLECHAGNTSARMYLLESLESLECLGEY